MAQVHIKWKRVLSSNLLQKVLLGVVSCQETVRKLMRDDRRIVAITPAMPVGSKMEGIKDFPERFLM